MHDATVARLVLDRRDVHVLGQVGRDHEAAVDVVARGRDVESPSESRSTRSGSCRASSRPGTSAAGGRSAGLPSGAPASAQAASVAISWLGERTVVLELRRRRSARPSRGASTGPRPPRRCRRPACGPARRSRAGTARPGPGGGTPGSSSGGSERPPCCRWVRDDAAMNCGIGQPTAATCGTLTASPSSTAAMASCNSLPERVRHCERLARRTGRRSVRGSGHVPGRR